MVHRGSACGRRMWWCSPGTVDARHMVRASTCGDLVEGALLEQVCLVQGKLRAPRAVGAALGTRAARRARTLPGRASDRAVRPATLSGALLLTVPLT